MICSPCSLALNLEIKVLHECGVAAVILYMRIQEKFCYLEKLVNNILRIYCMEKQNRNKILCSIKD